MNLIETRSLNVILEKPNNVIVDKSMFIEKYFIMMSLKIDPKYGLYKVNLFKKINNSLINVYNTLSIVHDHNLSTTKSPELFSITEINVTILFSIIIYLSVIHVLLYYVFINTECY